jgi:hypothetical protein
MPQSRSEGNFDFSKHRATFIHSVSFDDGKIVAKEPNKRPVVGQLDYQFPQSQDEDWIKSLLCLQIGASTMLLLKRGAESTQVTPDTMSLWGYSRVGLARNVHQTFFDGSVETIFMLGEKYEKKAGRVSY